MSGREPLAGQLNALFSASPDTERERFQSYFGRLGASVVDRLASQTLAPTGLTDAGLTARTNLEEASEAKGRADALETELAAARSKLEQANMKAEVLKRKLEAATLQAQSKTSMVQRRLAVTAMQQRELLAANLEKKFLSTATQRSPSIEILAADQADPASRH